MLKNLRHLINFYKGKSVDFLRLLQTSTRRLQDWEFVLLAGASEIVLGQIEDRDSGQALRARIAGLVAGSVGVLVRNPESVLAAAVRKTEAISAEALRWVADLADRSVLALQFLKMKKLNEILKKKEFKIIPTLF